MIEKHVAIEIQGHALKAIRELSDALTAAENRCSPTEYQQIKRGIGLSMGIMETELLAVVYAAHPDIDDLKDLL